MAQYGTFQYGTTLYGDNAAGTQTAFTGKQIWIMQVDWTNSGTFDGTNEANNIIEITACERGHEYYIRSDGSGFEPFQTGKLNVKMNNKDKRYDAYNTSSPLYPNVVPGRKVQFSVQEITGGQAGTKHVIMTGYINDIIPTNDTTGNVIIEVVDGMQFLNGQDVTTDTPLYKTTITEALNQTLTLSEWPYGRNIQTNTQPIVLFNLDNANAGYTLQALADASLGQVFVDKTGRFTYYSRDYSGMTTHNLDQEVLLKKIPTAQPWENVRNNIIVVANKPLKGELKTVWDVPGPITVEKGTTRTITAEWDSDFVEVQLTATQAKDNFDSGADISQNITLTYSINSKSAVFVLTNTNSVVDAYVYHLTLQGRELIPADISFKSTDATSKAAYGSRRFLLDNPYLQNVNHAEVFASAILAELKDPNKAPIIEIEGRPDIQFGFELLDKVALTASSLEIDDTFYIGKIEYFFPIQKTQSVVTRLYLQPRIFNDDTIADDPFDPGLPTIPTTGLVPGTNPIYPPPGPVLLECINDPGAAQNGPYSIFSDESYEIISGSTRTQFDFYFATVVRMSSATHKTVLTLRAERTVFISGQWYLTDNSSFYEVWAISSTGAALFEAETVITQGEYITATFAPSAGTVVAGFRVRAVAVPENSFDVGYTFDFDNGTQGFYVPPKNPLIANPEFEDLYSLSEPYDPEKFKFFFGSTGVLGTKGIVDKSGNKWIYKPINSYIDENSTFETTCLLEIPGGIVVTGFNLIGVLCTDGVGYNTEFTAGDGFVPRTQSVTFPPESYGKKIEAIVCHIGSPFYWFDVLSITCKFSTSTTSYKLRLLSASIENICAVPDA